MKLLNIKPSPLMTCGDFAMMVMDLRSHKTVTRIRDFEIPTRQYRCSMVNCPPHEKTTFV